MKKLSKILREEGLTKEGGLVSPDARKVLETLSQLGKVEVVSAVGNDLEFAIVMGPSDRIQITGKIFDDVFRFNVTHSTTTRGVIEVSSDRAIQRAEVQSILHLINH